MHSTAISLLTEKYKGNVSIKVNERICSVAFCLYWLCISIVFFYRTVGVQASNKSSW